MHLYPAGRRSQCTPGRRLKEAKRRGCAPRCRFVLARCRPCREGPTVGDRRPRAEGRLEQKRAQGWRIFAARRSCAPTFLCLRGIFARWACWGDSRRGGAERRRGIESIPWPWVGGRVGRGRFGRRGSRGCSPGCDSARARRSGRGVAGAAGLFRRVRRICGARRRACGGSSSPRRRLRPHSGVRWHRLA